MTPVAKALFAGAVLCFIIWGAALGVGLRPLVAATDLWVVYGEGEEFFSDAVAYRKAQNDAFFLLHLPHARPAYRWWTVDIGNQKISLSGPPRSFGKRHFVIRGDLDGAAVADQTLFRDWYWHFADGGAAFSGNGFTCIVRRPGY